MNLLALNLRILVNPPLQDLQLDRNRAIGLDITHEWSETGFLLRRRVTADKFGKNPVSLVGVRKFCITNK
jgi:hypothetical protein